MAATRALRFADHVTKRNEGSGNENGTTKTSCDLQNRRLSEIRGVDMILNDYVSVVDSDEILASLSMTLLTATANGKNKL